MEKEMRRMFVVLTAVMMFSTGMLFAHGGGVRLPPIFRPPA
jgi:hypothetical protein